jgi:hypothetical protein
MRTSEHCVFSGSERSELLPDVTEAQREPASVVSNASPAVGSSTFSSLLIQSSNPKKSCYAAAAAICQQLKQN